MRTETRSSVRIRCSSAYLSRRRTSLEPQGVPPRAACTQTLVVALKSPHVADLIGPKPWMGLIGLIRDDHAWIGCKQHLPPHLVPEASAQRNGLRTLSAYFSSPLMFAFPAIMPGPWPSLVPRVGLNGVRKSAKMLERGCGASACNVKVEVGCANIFFTV